MAQLGNEIKTMNVVKPANIKVPQNVPVSVSEKTVETPVSV